MEEIIYIYTLDCPITKEPKYVGKSYDVNLRFTKGHLKDEDKSKKTNWIKSLKKQNLKPDVTIIDSVNKKEWKFWEKHYISLYRSWGFNLKNMTEGGDGVDKGTIPWNKGIKYDGKYPKMRKTFETKQKIAKTMKILGKCNFKNISYVPKNKTLLTNEQILEIKTLYFNNKISKVKIKKIYHLGNSTIEKLLFNLN